jgi:2-polyprenyl-3-methyl-5-hydroxy-6-metoxy-1,4-benzoquinol methylase/Zn ribbon nucleic-acid-binding protein
VAPDVTREVKPRLVAGSCPVCGGNEWARHEWVRQSEVVKCVSCGLGRTVPTPDAFAQDYGTARGAVLRSGERPLWRRFAKTQLELLGPPASDRGRPARLLDVGSSVGALVDEATLRGWCAAGFEPDYDACAIARHSVGGAVVNSFLGPNSVRAGSFDAVVLSHVLEHVDDPSEMLRAVWGALSDGGRLLVACPNFSGGLARLQGARWYGYAIDQHVWHFTPLSLARAVKNAGFTIVKVHSSQVMQYRSRFLPRLTQPFIDLAIQMVRRIGLGDEVVVVGRRPKVSSGATVP